MTMRLSIATELKQNLWLSFVTMGVEYRQWKQSDLDWSLLCHADLPSMGTNFTVQMFPASYNQKSTNKWNKIQEVQIGQNWTESYQYVKDRRKNSISFR